MRLRSQPAGGVFEIQLAYQGQYFSSLVSIPDQGVPDPVAAVTEPAYRMQHRGQALFGNNPGDCENMVFIIVFHNRRVLRK